MAERVISLTCASQNGVVVRRGLGELGRAPRDVAAGDRPLPEHVAQAVAEAVAQLRDLLVGRAAVGAGVAAVLDQREVGRRRAEHVVARRVDGAVEPIGLGGLGHWITLRAARSEANSPSGRPFGLIAAKG